MTCTPATFEINKSLYMQPMPIKDRVIIAAAYYAVDETGLAAYSRFDNNWTIGPEILYKKFRARPVVLARALVCYYLWLNDRTLQAIADVFGFNDHTTVMHLRSKVLKIISQRHESEEKQAYIIFKNKLNF